MRRDRDSFFEQVAPATREMIERAITGAGTRLSNYSKVLLAIIDLTTTWSKVSDRMYVSQIASIARLKGDAGHRETRRELQKLEQDGVIFCRRNGRGQIQWVSLVEPARAVQSPLLRVVDRTGEDVPREPGRMSPTSRGESPPPTEEVIRAGPSDVDKHERRFERLVKQLGLNPPLDAARAAFDEAPTGCERLAQSPAVQRADNPAGRWLAEVRHNRHLALEPRTEEERAMSWAHLTAWQHKEEHVEDVLDSSFPGLPIDVRARVLDVAAAARRERAA